MMCYCIISCDNLGQAIGALLSSIALSSTSAVSLFANFSEQYARVGYRTIDRGRQSTGGGRRCLRTVYVAPFFWLVVWSPH